MDQSVLPMALNFVDDVIAARQIRSANRILVIGCSGGGKSTLSQKLAQRFGLTYISFDRDIFWMPGWTERPRTEQRELITEMVARERWIMDGSNPSSFDLRLPRADLVIWMQISRLVCIWSVFKRWIMFFGRTRPEMAPGCIEKVDWEFVRFIWTYDKKFTPRFWDGIAAHGPQVPVLQLKSRRQTRELLDLLGTPA
ncbi:AAA family ATPase [Rhizobium sp. BK376]|uniref:AAA family ATPase n=1 Tax=Rhizobium sp. BK376 TaxID=2512149 RepID=UPI00104D373F|nr:AAA family ATPase [Rhizobium sp. BK376]TCR85399.1 adenylate kinase family enzyme [Rhizobium sp. BK376]